MVELVVLSGAWARAKDKVNPTGRVDSNRADHGREM